MRRHLFNLLAALSLLVGIAVAGVWVRSHRGSTIRNDSIQWYLHRAPTLRSFSFVAHPTFVTFSTSDPVPPRDQLIAALEKPESFAAAHVLLLNGPAPAPQPGNFDSDSAHRSMALRIPVTLQDQPDGSCLAIIDGLRVVLRTTEEKGKYFGQARVDHRIYSATVEVDESQQAAIRNQWNRRASPAVEPHSRRTAVTVAVCCVSLIVPLIYLKKRRQRLQRESDGHCLQCGYDLRASPERCPECGTIAEAPTTNPEPRTTHP